MTDTQKRVEEKIEEYYNRMSDYIPKDEELKEMCQNCECWCGENHDYSECRNKPCFRFFLGYGYLQWATSWE